MNWPSMLPWCILAVKGPLALLLTSLVWGLLISLFIEE